MGLNLSRNLLLENANNNIAIPEYKRLYIQPVHEQSYIREIINEMNENMRLINYELLEMTKPEFDTVLNEGERLDKVGSVISNIISTVIKAVKTVWGIIKRIFTNIKNIIGSKFKRNIRPKEVESMQVSKYMDILNAALIDRDYSMTIADIVPTDYLKDPEFPKTKLTSMDHMKFVMEPLHGIMVSIGSHTMNDIENDMNTVAMVKEELHDFKDQLGKELFGSFTYTTQSLVDSADIIKKDAFGDTTPKETKVTIGLFQQAMKNIKYGKSKDIVEHVASMENQINRGYSEMLTLLGNINEMVNQRKSSHQYTYGPYKRQYEMIQNIIVAIQGIASIVYDGIQSHMILMTYKCQRIAQVFADDPRNMSVAVVKYCDNLVMSYLKNHDDAFRESAQMEGLQEQIISDNMLEEFLMELEMGMELYRENLFEQEFYNIIMEADDDQQNNNNAQNNQQTQANTNQQTQNNNATQNAANKNSGRIKALISKIIEAITNIWNKFRDRIGQFVQLDAAWWKKNRAAAVSLDVSKVKVNQWYNYDIDKFSKDTYIKWNPQDDAFDSDENTEKAIYNAIGGTPTAADDASFTDKVKSLYYTKYIDNQGEDSGVEFGTTGLNVNDMIKFIDDFVQGLNGGILGNIRKELDQINQDAKTIQRNYDNLAKQFKENPQNAEKNNQDQAQKAEEKGATPQNASYIDTDMTYMKYLSEAAMSSKDRNRLPDSEFGLPKQRRFPLNDEKHVLLAIRFFNHVEPEYESELAKNIIKKIKAYDMADKVHVGDKNRFKPYWEKSGLAKKAVTEMEELFSFNLADTLGLYDVQREANVQPNEELKAQIAQNDGTVDSKVLDEKISRCFNYNSKAISAKMTQAVAAYKQYISFYKVILGANKNNNKNDQQQNQNNNNNEEQK